MQNSTSYPKEKINILLLEGIHQSAVAVFKSQGYKNIDTASSAYDEKQLLARIDKYHLIGIRSKTKLTKAVLAKAQKLLGVGCFCIGTNQVDMTQAMLSGLAVFNSPYSNTRSVAELVIGECIMLMRKIFEKNHAAHQGGWVKSSSGCYEVRGKTLGIVGYGHIGSQVSVLAEAIGMKVVFYDVVPKMALGNAYAVKSLDELLSISDMVTLHVPQTTGTKNLINTDRIKKMKKGAVLINCARGNVVEIDAVKQALQKQKLAGYAADVFPEEPQSNDDVFKLALQGMPNVILTPHIGGSTVEAQENIGIDVATKMLAFLESGSSVGSLTVPELSLPMQNNTHRLLHIHQNVPGVLSEVNSFLSQHNVNILGQYLKTNERIGYVVLDIDKKTSGKALEALRQVKATIKVRSLY
jgi:D-3-phosphoglycerate dehydrogenase